MNEAYALLKQMVDKVASTGVVPTHLFVGEADFDYFKEAVKELNLIAEIDNRIASGICYVGPKVSINEAIKHEAV